MITNFIALPLAVIGVILALTGNPLGLILVIVGALIFVAGHRRAKQKLEQKRHEEMVEATRNR